VKCVTHDSEAIGVCVYCGRAVCGDCAVTGVASQKDSQPQRLICSSRCSEAAQQNEKVLRLLLQKSVENSRASAFYCYLCSLLSGAAAVVAWFMLPSPFLILFTAGCSIALLLSGWWYGRVASKRTA